MPKMMNYSQQDRILLDFKKSGSWLALLPFAMSLLKAFLAWLETQKMGIASEEG